MKEGWKRHKLNELADMRLGKMLDQNKNKGEFYDYLANVNVQWGEIILDNLKQMKFESSEFDRYGLNVGDIVMCEGGEPGRCSIWKGQRKVMMIQKALHRIRAKSEVNSYFLYYYLFYRGKSGYFEGYFTGSTIKHFTGESLAKVEIDIPPIQTQRKIASILSGYDDLIENNLKRIKILEEMAQQTYEEWFVRMRFPGYESAVMNEETGLPEGWEKVSLDTIIKFKVDNRGRNPKYYCEDGIPVLDNHLITNSSYVNLNNAKRFLDADLFDNFLRKYLEPNDVLITLVGTVGSIALAPKEKCAIIQNTIGLRCNNLCTPYYLFLFLKINRQTILNKNRGSAQPSVKVGDLLSTKINLPELTILDEFERICKAMFYQINNLGNQNQRLREARDLLLPRLMMGVIEL